MTSPTITSAIEAVANCQMRYDAAREKRGSAQGPVGIALADEESEAEYNRLQRAKEHLERIKYAEDAAQDAAPQRREIVAMLERAKVIAREMVPMRRRWNELYAALGAAMQPYLHTAASEIWATRTLPWAPPTPNRPATIEELLSMVEVEMRNQDLLERAAKREVSK